MSDRIDTQTVSTGLATRPGYRILQPLQAEYTDAELAELQSRLLDALKDYSELADQTIYVGVLDPDEKRDVHGRAYWYNNLIVFPPNRIPANVTIYHELGHLAIHRLDENGEDHPTTSEEYCSIFSMAKMPPKAVDEQYVPYLGETEKDTERIPEICERALEYRKDHRNYIQKCKEWLEI